MAGPTGSLDLEAPSDVLSSLASRNPTRVVIPIRVHHRPKITADAKRLLNRENAAALQLEVEEVFDVRNTEISRIAKSTTK
jgi:ABC-type lipoprotein export system ATPase subunit